MDDTFAALMKFYGGGLGLKDLENMSLRRLGRYIGNMNKYIKAQNDEIAKSQKGSRR